MHSFKQFSLSGSFRISNLCRIRALCYDHIRPQSVNPRRPQMSISRHIVVPRVDDTHTLILYMEHDRPQHMAGIVGLHFDSLELHRLMKLYDLDFSEAFLDLIRGVANIVSSGQPFRLLDKLHLFVLSAPHLHIVFQHQGYNGLCGVCHDDRAVKPDHLREVGQRPTMVKMEMTHKTEVNLLPDLGQVFEQEGEVGEPLLRDHVDPTVKQDAAVAHDQEDAGPADVLASSEGDDLNCHY